MRLRHVAILARMLLRFFGRRVLSVGPLRSLGVRWVALVAAVALYALVTASVIVFLGSLDLDESTWPYLMDVQSVQVVLWVLIAFLLVKVLFLNAAGLLDLTVHLPLVGKERAAGFLLYEVAMVSIIVAALSSAFVTATFVELGPGAAGGLIVAIIIPAALAYAVAAIVFELVGRVVGRAGFARVRDAAALTGMFALVLAYATTVAPSLQALADGPLNGSDPFVWQAALAWATRRIGLLVPILGGTALVVGLLSLALWCVTPRRPRTARYLTVFTGAARRGYVGPYDLAFLRSTQTALAASISAAAFVVLVLTGAANPLWSLSVVGMGCLYHYAATLDLASNGPKITATTCYLRLLRAPVLFVGVLAVPEALIVVLMGAGPQEILLPLGSAWVGIIVLECVGIVFPAENDNPFSVFIGMSLVVVMIGLMSIGIGLLQLPGPVAGIVIVALLSSLVVYSIQGINSLNARSRHEEGPSRRQQHTRSGSRDRRGRSRDFAVTDVLD